ncbi:Imm32 family immunity protein [[Kitasatospora] papulosa]
MEGDRQGLTALADELRSIARMDDGGHQHIEYFPDHCYLAAGSLAMVVKSPHGGMPTRWPPPTPVGSGLSLPSEPLNATLISRTPAPSITSTSQRSKVNCAGAYRRTPRRHGRVFRYGRHAEADDRCEVRRSCAIVDLEGAAASVVRLPVRWSSKERRPASCGEMQVQGLPSAPCEASFLLRQGRGFLLGRGLVGRRSLQGR